MDAGASTTSVLLAAAVTLLAGYLVYEHMKFSTFWSSRGVKGPAHVPVLGSAFNYMFNKKIYQDEEWHRKYGKTFGASEGRARPVLKTIDNELIKFIFIKEFSSFSSRNDLDIHGKAMKRWLFFSDPQHWANQRAIISPLFSSASMKSMLGMISNCLDRFSSELKRKLSSNGDRIKEEKASVSKDELFSLNMDIIATTFFSLKLDTYRDKTSEFFKRAFAFATPDLKYIFLFWVWVPTFLAKWFQIDPVPNYQVEYIDRLCQSIIDEQRKNPKTGTGKRNMVQMLLEAELPDGSQAEPSSKQDDKDDAHYNDGLDGRQVDKLVRQGMKRAGFRKFDDIEIRAQATFFFLAGFDTTSSSMHHCFYQLAHFPQIQEELLEELRSVGKPATEFDSSDLQRLYKLDAFISETFRLFPPVIDVTRRVTNPDGVWLPTEPPIHLPDKTVISVSPKPLHVHPDYWEEPLKFDMTRFYPENKHKITSCAYMPFGLGPRYCAGTRFALMAIKMTLAWVLYDYKVLVGKQSTQYPPEYKQHLFFMQMKSTDFNLVPRK